MELETISTIATIFITLLGSMGVTVPFIAKLKSKLSQTKALVIAIDQAFEDDTITVKELKGILRYAREIIGTKKV